MQDTGTDRFTPNRGLSRFSANRVCPGFRVVLEKIRGISVTWLGARRAQHEEHARFLRVQVVGRNHVERIELAAANDATAPGAVRAHEYRRIGSAAGVR